MLKQRTITALILSILFIPSIFFLPSGVFGVLLAVFILLAAWEWSRLSGWQSPLSQGLYVASNAAFLVLVALWPSTLVYVIALAVLWWLLASFWVVNYQRNASPLPTSPWLKSLLGFFILIPAWQSLVYIHSSHGSTMLFGFFMLIWTADIAAYFSGRRWGKRKLADRVSPGKSWEGVYGALLGCLSFSMILGTYLTTSVPGLLLFVILSLITVIFSILGDLLESLFKRQMGMKDSSQLLPGHGGVLDRIDSLTAAAPIFVFGLLILEGAQLL